MFSWDNRSLEGRQKISAYISGTFSTAQLFNIRLVVDVVDLARALRTFEIPHTRAVGVELTSKFACRYGHGRGNARLLRDVGGTYRAITVMAELADLNCHEKSLATWCEPSSRSTESGHPYVLIGQSILFLVYHSDQKSHTFP